MIVQKEFVKGEKQYHIKAFTEGAESATTRPFCFIRKEITIFNDILLILIILYEKEVKQCCGLE